MKGVGGFYTVKCGTESYTCRARGKFRLQDARPLPGDRVDIDVLPDGSGWIRQVLPRRNAFVRPPVCNVDALVLVASGAPPRSDRFLIDRMTVVAARKSADALICVNKIDLESAEELVETYRSAGFAVFPVCALTGGGVAALAAAIAGRTVAFTGHSGVGKSALLNALEGGGQRPTGEVSARLGRGRHTTRHVELFELPGRTLAADTPGFSAFDADEAGGRLDEYFPDFAPYRDQCRFHGCLHVGVAGCAVAAAVCHGGIAPSRYESYQKLLEIPNCYK